MKTLSSVTTRRDRCYICGRRGAHLSEPQAAAAWYFLSGQIEALGEKDIPKFADLLVSYRAATIVAIRTTTKPSASEASEDKPDLNAKPPPYILQSEGGWGQSESASSA